MYEHKRKYYRPDNLLINEARRTIHNKRSNPYKEQLFALAKMSRLAKVAGLMELLAQHHRNTLIHSFEDAFLAVNLARGIFGEPSAANLAGYVELFEDGLLHDIGKLGVPQELLNVEDRSSLKEDDRKIIRMHGAYGGAILNLVGLKSRTYISYEHDLASGIEKSWRGIVDLDSRHELTEIVSLADLVGGLMDPRRPYHPAVDGSHISWVIDVKGQQGVFSAGLVRAFKERISAKNLYPPFTIDDYRKNKLFMALVSKYGLGELFETAISEDRLTRQKSNTKIVGS